VVRFHGSLPAIAAVGNVDSGTYANHVGESKLSCHLKIRCSRQATIKTQFLHPDVVRCTLMSLFFRSFTDLDSYFSLHITEYGLCGFSYVVLL